MMVDCWFNAKCEQRKVQKRVLPLMKTIFSLFHSKCLLQVTWHFFNDSWQRIIGNMLLLVT